VRFIRLEIQDFKAIAKADLPLERRGLVLVQGVNEDTDAADSNGAGKTTIFEAISWCLFGAIVGQGARLAEEVIRLGAERATVVLVLEHDGHEYTIRRRRTARGGSLDLCCDGEATNGRTQGETEARIRELVGLDWDAFRNTVLHGQGDHARFADRGVTDSDRKDILKRILRLERFDLALERVREARKKVATDLAGLEGEARQLQGEYSQALRAVGRLEGASGAWKADHARRLEEASEEVIAELTDSEWAIVGKLPRMTELLGKLKGRIADAKRACEEQQGARFELDRATARVERLRSDLAEHERTHARAVKALNDATASADERTCPTCGQDVKEGNTHLLRHLEELQSDIDEAAADVEAWAARIEEAEQARGGFEMRLGVAVEVVETTGDLDRWAREHERIAGLIEEGRVLEARALGYNEARRRHDERIAALEKETDPTVEQLAEARRSVFEIDRLQGENAAAQIEVKAKDRPLAFWEKAYSNKGLPSYALDTVVPMISTAANRYLQILADGDLQVEVTTTTDLKGGGARESLDFRFLVEGAENVTPSGGQWRKFGLAIDLALMDLVAAREGAQIDLLLLDEVLDGLDAEGRSRVVALLRHLRETRSSIFVVSHDPTLAEAFENVIVVRKCDGSSVVEEA
jgi:DNA repair exonuclease SbcCD ATPase subunit